jgi:hypothetical protein
MSKNKKKRTGSSDARCAPSVVVVSVNVVVVVVVVIDGPSWTLSGVVVVVFGGPGAAPRFGIVLLDGVVVLLLNLPGRRRGSLWCRCTLWGWFTALAVIRSRRPLRRSSAPAPTALALLRHAAVVIPSSFSPAHHGGGGRSRRQP